MALRLISRQFTDVQGRTGAYPKGVSNDLTTAKYTIEYTCNVDLSTVVQVIKNGNRFRLVSGSWESLNGSFKGANVDFDLNGAGMTSTTIDSVDGSDLYLVNDGGHADATYSVGYFTVTDDPVSFEHYINLFQNSKKQGSKYSLIDNETQRFKVDLANALIVAGTDTFVQFGNKSGGSIITSDITRIADVAGNKRYEIESTFKLWVFLDDAIYSADNSIGFYTDIKAIPLLGSTISSMSLQDSILGDVGNKDESLNGGASPWTLNNILWTDASLNTMSALDPSQKSYFTITIDGNFTGSEEFNFKLYRTPTNDAEYKNKPLPIDNNVSLLINDTLIGYGAPTTKTGNANADGAYFIVQTLRTTNNTTSIEITGSITCNDDMETLLLSDGGYVFEILIDDGSATYETASTVNVLCDENTAVVNTIPLGVYTTNTLLIEDLDGNDVGARPELMTEDYIRLSSTFTLPKDTIENPWSSISLKVVAVKTDGTEFDLEDFTYNIGDLPAMRDGTLSLDYTTSRGYRLPDTSDKNEVSIQLYPALDTGAVFGVEISYPFQVRYEYWLSQPNASDDFYGNKTKNWYTYSNDADWRVEARIVIVRDTGTYTTPFDFTIGTGSLVFVRTFETIGGTPLTKPLRSEITRMITTVTALKDWNGNEWAIEYARPKEGVPNWSLSSVEDPTNNANPLQPDSLQTRLELTTSAKDMILTCLFDPSKIDVENVTFATRVHGTLL